MKLGPHQINNKLILAPMAGVTDRPFRQLCRQSGAGMVVSEMIHCHPALLKTKKTQQRMNHTGESGPVVVQIAGGEPLMLAEFAKLNVDKGADVIDINMGCPAKKVCRTLAGSALLNNVPLVAKILTAVVAAVAVPVTLKIRTGWSTEQKNAIDIACIAENAGIQAVTVHGRTRACGFTASAEYDTIAAVKSRVNIPVIANGDITSPEKAAQVLRYTQADALMIGRAALGNPFIFREIEHYLKHRCLPGRPGMEELVSVLTQHLENVYDFYGEYSGLRIARKHIAWYCQQYANNKEFKARVNRVDNAAQQLKMVKEYFHQHHSTQLAA